MVAVAEVLVDCSFLERVVHSSTARLTYVAHTLSRPLVLLACFQSGATCQKLLHGWPDLAAAHSDLHDFSVFLVKGDLCLHSLLGIKRYPSLLVLRPTEYYSEFVVNLDRVKDIVRG